MCQTVEGSAAGLAENATEQQQQKAIKNLGQIQSICADFYEILRYETPE